MKLLYEFNLTENLTVKEPQMQKDAEGKEIEVLVPKEVGKSHSFALLKPSRALIDDGSLFYTVKFSELIKAGVLTVSQLRKRMLQEGGVISEKERQEIVAVYSRHFLCLGEIDALNTIPNDKKTDDDKAKMLALRDEMSLNLGKINDFESQINLFEETAESKARGKTIVWWALQLSYVKKGDKYEPIFGQGGYEDKLKEYDKIYDSIEQYPFFNKTFGTFLQLVSTWYGGRANTKEEFDALLASI